MIGSYIPEKKYREYVDFDNNLTEFAKLYERSQVSYVGGASGVGKSTLVHHYFSTCLAGKSDQLTYWIDMNGEPDMIVFNLRDLIKRNYFIQDLEKYSRLEFLSLFYETLQLHYHAFQVTLVFDGVLSLENFQRDYIQKLEIPKGVKLVVILDGCVQSNLSPIEGQLHSVHGVNCSIPIPGLVMVPSGYLLLQQLGLLNEHPETELQLIGRILEKLSSDAAKLVNILSFLDLKELHMSVIPERFLTFVDELVSKGVIDRVALTPLIRPNRFLCSLLLAKSNPKDEFNHFRNEVMQQLQNAVAFTKETGLWEYHAIYQEKYHLLHIETCTVPRENSYSYYEVMVAMQKVNLFTRCEKYYNNARSYADEELRDHLALLHAWNLRSHFERFSYMDVHSICRKYCEPTLENALTRYRGDCYSEAITMLQDPIFKDHKEPEELLAKSLICLYTSIQSPIGLKEISYANSTVTTRISKFDEALSLLLKHNSLDNPLVVNAQKMLCLAKVGYSEYMDINTKAKYSMDWVLQTLQQCLLVLEQCQPFNHLSIIEVLNGLGKGYMEIDQYDQSLQWFNRILSYPKPLDKIIQVNRAVLGDIYHHIAILYQKTGKPDYAFEYQLKSFLEYKKIMETNDYSNNQRADFKNTLKIVINYYSSKPEKKRVLYEHLQLQLQYYKKWDLKEEIKKEQIKEHMKDLEKQFKKENPDSKDCLIQ
ncbi:hypothetical protein DLAC_07342 [Tieghemostelium lacteum]|uniref:Uncharacterized protein n=1 Tax=Tieghemostelium lacteum TaxID=361077 RepID=A0A151ZC96_TIELA|nr:hypothetical protein DLAC_07342 [Tieghemostelium lacteum]|eukprot:KYQ91572.1 hypothetical protein DLAC_07342 [Tieghemostelium lacteum]